jgi:hypothetical protein
MIKHAIAVLGVTGLVLSPAVLAQVTKYGVTVTAQKNVDFSKFATYSWTQGRGAYLKATDAHIKAAIDREMAGLGMKKVAGESGDVLVLYQSLTRSDIDLKGDPSGDKPYPVGTLVVALLQPGSHKELLRLRTDRPIDVAAGKLEAAIDSAVTELFQRYPTRSKRK